MTAAPPVRLADLAARHREVAGEVESRVLQALRSGRWIRGPTVAEAERVAAEALGREAAAGVASGTDALMLALQAVGVGRGDEVIVPTLTFFATAGAVCAIGATPVIVDVREDGLIDDDAAGAAHTERTRAVIPVHLFGNRADPPALGVPVVDDAAQAFGAVPPPTVGRLTTLSTYPTKPWGSAGHGGFVVGDAPDVERVRRLGHHGAGPDGRYHATGAAIGRNSGLDEIQAAVLLGHLPRVGTRIARRREIAARYDAGLPSGVRPVPRQPGNPVPLYLVLADRRRAVQAALDQASVEWKVYYPAPLAAQPALASAVHHPTPVADTLCEQLLALPVHAGLTDDDVDRVLGALHQSGS